MYIEKHFSISVSVLSLSTIMEYFPSLMFNQPSPVFYFFSPQGVSFESFSSISRTRLYSNAIRQGIKGTSIICITHLFQFMALKDSNLKQTLILPCFYLWRNILQASVIVMKSCSGSWVKRASIYILHWQLHFVTDGYRLLDGWCHVK